MLAPLGALLGHAVAYGPLVARHGDGAAPHQHGYLGPVATVGVPLGLLVLAWLTVDRWGSRARLPPLPALMAGQAALFVAQETVERLVVRLPAGGVLSAPAVRWGLASQVVVAAGVVAVTRLARHLWTVIWALARPAPMVLAGLGIPEFPPTSPPRRAVVVARYGRAPPRQVA